jgi:VRR-NUC domain
MRKVRDHTAASNQFRADPSPKELVLHISLADNLRWSAAPGWLWGHYPAGEHRDLRTAAKLKAMGVQRGWPDLLLFSPSGQLHALELKRIGGRLTVDQEAFATWCAKAGVPHAVVRSLDEAIRCLSGWGALRVKIADVSPPLDDEPCGRWSDLPEHNSPPTGGGDR